MLTLDQATAQRIVDRAMPIIGHSVNVMTPEGVIIASGDAQRVGEVHQAAIIVARTGDALVLDTHQAQQFPGVRAGVNLPVRMNSDLVAVVGISGSPDKVLPFADLVRVTAELILEQSALLEVSRHRRRQIENTLLALLDGETVPQSWLDQLGVDLSKPRIAVVLQSDETPVSATSAPSNQPFTLPEADDLARQWERSAPDVLVLSPKPGTLALFLPETDADKALSAALGLLGLDELAPVSAAAGAPFRGDLKACFDSAGAALAAGQSQRNLSRGRHTYQQRPLATLWRSLNPQWQQTLLHRSIEPILQHPRRDPFIKTLRAFMACDGDVQRCAEALHLHRNSVRYRLKSIETLTGFSPYRHEDLLILYLAIEIPH
ncbi:MAG: sugar diacid recognition domain-containing protein [Pseudomonadota bacterium]|nr:sugar diacid recognition domain-containing protein [Pseudomonadota bacterium]